MKVKLEDEIIMTKLDNEIALLNQKNGRYFSLNETGARIWELLCEKGDTEEAVNGILEEYSIDEPSLRNDMDTLIAQLINAGLLDKI